jgi:hypothetical protein
VARPTKLTPEVREAIVKAVRAGAPRSLAARAAGVSEATLHRWLAQGRDEGKGPRHELVKEIEQAEAKAHMHAVACWLSAMKSDWRACESYLARRDPEQWSRQRLGHVPAASDASKRDSVSGAGEQRERLLGGAPADLTKLSEAQLRQLESLRRAARR